MIRKLLSVSVSVAAAAAATLALGAIPASAAGPAATATPNSGLHDLQVISITGSGYNPTSRIQVEECAGTVASPPADNTTCEGLTLNGSTISDGTGAFHLSYRVFELPDHAFTFSTIQCDPNNPCVLYVGQDQNDFTQPKSFVQISFSDQTSTGVACTPATVEAGTPSSCTATVADTANGTHYTPTGTVSFSAVGGAASPASCTLDATGKCSVNVTPSKSGAISVSGAYGGDAAHDTSTGSTSVTSTARPTATTISCSPSSVAALTPSTCTVTVKDTDPSPITPTGTVTLSAPSGTGTFATPTCTLAAGSCTDKFTPSAPAASIALGATYGGDAAHTGSTGSTTVAATKVPTRLTAHPVILQLSPLGINLNESATLVDVLGRPVAGQPVTFNAGGPICTANTNGAGLASCSLSLSAVTGLGFSASYAGNAVYLPSSGSAGLVG